MRPIVLEGRFNPRSIRGGEVYVAPSSSDAYGYLQALVISKQAKSLGRAILMDGREAIAVSTARNAGELKANGEALQVWIPDDAFERAIDEYKNWREAWWREAIQNGVDNDAHNVVLNTQLLDADYKPIKHYYEARWVEVSCEDDGTGMTVDIIKNKLMVYRGTTKRESGSSAGGFGKAKEVLFFAWPMWSIYTCPRPTADNPNPTGIMVSGHGPRADYDEAPPRVGTLVKAIMPIGKYADASAAKGVIGKSWLPRVRFIVNGERVEADMRAGREVENLGNGNLTIHYTKQSPLDRSAVMVRDKSGLWMFDVWPPEDFKGLIVGQLRVPSIKMLTSNRDSLIQEYQRPLEQFVLKLASDIRSAIKPNKNLMKKRYDGAGKFKGEKNRDRQAALAAGLGAFQPVGRDGKFSKDQIGKLKDTLKQLGQPDSVTDVVEPVSPEAEADAPLEFSPQVITGSPYPGGGATLDGAPARTPGLDLRPLVDLVPAMLEDADIKDAAHAEAAVKQMSWEPDFYIINELEDWRPRAYFEPEKMRPRLRQLARFWAELVRWVLIQVGCDSEYGVGWHFCYDPYTGGYFRGSYLQDSTGEHWVLLNPFIGGNPANNEFYSLANKSHINTLFSIAIHECVHLAARHARHNEDFSSTLTEYIALTAGKSTQIEKIRKACVARATSSGGKKQSQSRQIDWDLSDVSADDSWDGYRIYDVARDSYVAIRDTNRMRTKSIMDAAQRDLVREFAYPVEVKLVGAGNILYMDVRRQQT